MMAAVCREVGKAMEIEDISISKPIGREVPVRLNVVGVRYSDLHILAGALARTVIVFDA